VTILFKSKTESTLTLLFNYLELSVSGAP